MKEPRWAPPPEVPPPPCPYQALCARFKELLLLPGNEGGGLKWGRGPTYGEGSHLSGGVPFMGGSPIYGGILLYRGAFMSAEGRPKVGGGSLRLGGNF